MATVTKEFRDAWQFETKALHIGQESPDPASDARAVPIYQTTSYVFRNSQHAADRFGLADAGNIYGRMTTSTQGVFEDRIAALEGGVGGLALASGAAAVTYTIQALATAGEHIVAQKTIYGGSSNDYREFHPNDLMQWNMMKWAIQSGSSLYDFQGVCTDPAESEELYGVYLFKCKFNGEVVKFAGEFIWDEF